LLGFSIFSIFLSIQPKGFSTPSTPPKEMRVCVTRTPRWPTDFGRVRFPLCPFVALTILHLKGKGFKKTKPQIVSGRQELTCCRLGIIKNITKWK
jgi:hypothetical protein